jgi:hypothetical protein
MELALTGHNVSSLVVDRLCDQARGQNTPLTCFHLELAVRKEQSVTSILGSLLRQGRCRNGKGSRGNNAGLSSTEKGHWWTKTRALGYREVVRGGHVLATHICMHRRLGRMGNDASSQSP